MGNMFLGGHVCLQAEGKSDSTFFKYRELIALHSSTRNIPAPSILSYLNMVCGSYNISSLELIIFYFIFT